MVESSCWFPPFVALAAVEGEGSGAPAGLGGVRWEKVALIRARLADGRYKVAASEVAEAMLGRAVVAVETEAATEFVPAMQ